MAEPKRFILEVWVCVASDGDYEVGTDSEQVIERFQKERGNFNQYKGFRLYKLNLNVPAPAAIEIAATVPDNINEPTTLVLT